MSTVQTISIVAAVVVVAVIFGATIYSNTPVVKTNQTGGITNATTNEQKTVSLQDIINKVTNQ